jgi:hypothetical protein
MSIVTSTSVNGFTNVKLTDIRPIGYLLSGFPPDHAQHHAKTYTNSEVVRFGKFPHSLQAVNRKLWLVNGPVYFLIGCHY